MSLTVQQSDAEILSNFNNMEEGQEYILNDFWFAEMNRVRKDNKWPPIQKREEYKFLRRGQKLFLNSREVFVFTGKSNLAFAFSLTFTFALTLALAFADLTLALTHALQHNGLERLNKDTCEGKVVEIDGKKYKLTSV